MGSAKVAEQTCCSSSTRTSCMPGHTRHDATRFHPITRAVVLPRQVLNFGYPRSGRAHGIDRIARVRQQQGLAYEFAPGESLAPAQVCDEGVNAAIRRAAPPPTMQALARVSLTAPA